MTSEDVISRQAVIDSLHSKFADGFDSDRWWNSMSVLYVINKVPSVSTEKTGRWIRWYEVIESADGKSTDHIPHCKCSECDCEYDTYSSQFIKYCSNCGAKMGVKANDRAD